MISTTFRYLLSMSFACILFDGVVGFYADLATFDVLQICLRIPDLRRKVEQLYPCLLSDAIDEEQGI